MLASSVIKRAPLKRLAAGSFAAARPSPILRARSQVVQTSQILRPTMASAFSTTAPKGSSMPSKADTADYDPEIRDIASYVHNYKIDSDLALDTSRYILLDTIGCGLEALRFPQCTAVLGPIVPGTTVPNGTRVPGTPFILDPVNGAFNIGTMIRWLDYNDCWLAAEWGHPSDNLWFSFISSQSMTKRCFHHNLVKNCAVVQRNCQGVGDGSEVRIMVVLGKLWVLNTLDTLSKVFKQR